MRLNPAILQTSTKQEVVDTFNAYSLRKKIILCENFSHLREVLKDDKGDYYLRSMGSQIFAKQYLRSNFCDTYGYIKEIDFYYIKDTEEDSQEMEINRLIDG